MAINSGHPHCTKWKNHQYKHTKGILGIDYTEESSVDPLTLNKPTIWITDEHVLDADSTEHSYQINFTNGITDDLSGISRPEYWVSGVAGSRNVASGTTVKFDLSDLTYDLNTRYSVKTVESYTGDNLGAGVSLITISPGMMIGLPHYNSVRANGYSNTSTYEWKVLNPKENCLHQKNKLMTGTSTSWI